MRHCEFAFIHIVYNVTKARKLKNYSFQLFLDHHCVSALELLLFSGIVLCLIRLIRLVIAYDAYYTINTTQTYTKLHLLIYKKKKKNDTYLIPNED